MDLSSPNLPNMYFKKVIHQDLGEVSMDAAMMRLLMAIDENKSISQVAKETRMNLATIRQTLSKLHKLGLVEPVNKSGPVLDEAFLGQLRQHISRAVGPIGEFLVEDVAADMGLSVEKIPVSRAPDLIVALAKEIPDEQTRLEFERSMIRIIPKG